MNHVVKRGNGSAFIRNQRKVHCCLLSLVDILHPTFMFVERINTHCKHLHITLGELFLKHGRSSKFSGAHRSIVCRMRKQNSPACAEVFIKIYWTFCGLRGKIRRGVSKSKCHSNRFWGEDKDKWGGNSAECGVRSEQCLWI